TIVNIGGGSAHFGARRHAHVMTAKAGLLGLTRALAMDLGPRVPANCLVPGIIIDASDDPESTQRRTPHSTRHVPAERTGTIEDISEAVAMLCERKKRFITGQAIHVNGGAYFSS